MENVPIAITNLLNGLVAMAKRTTGNRYDGLYLDNDTGSFSFTSAPMVTSRQLATNDADLDYAKSMLVTNEYVYNVWHRISRGSVVSPEARTAAGFTDNSNQSELDAFTYDQPSDVISNPSDSDSMLGLVSTSKSDQYILDVEITSLSSTQNDPVGLLLGYVRDEDGTTHTLTIMRNLYPDAYEGGPHALNIVVDYLTPGQVIIGGISDGLDWASGEDATGAYTIPEGFDATNVKPWDQAPNGVRMRAVRSGDTFTIKASKYDSDVLEAASEIIFTLDDDPTLDRFRGPSAYGYVSVSQDQVNWKATQRPLAGLEVMDTRDQTIHSWSGTAWVSAAAELDEGLNPSRIYYSDYNGKAYRTDALGNVTQITTTTT